MITTSDDYLAEIIAIIQQALISNSYQIHLFGSRARGDNTAVSDYDIAVQSTEDLSLSLSVAREMLEESTIPFMVDLVDLQTTSDSFREEIRQEGVLLWKN